MNIEIKFLTSLTLILFSNFSMASNRDKNLEECPVYSFGVSAFTEKLSKGSARPIVPIGKFYLDEESEKYLLSKIPHPVLFKDHATKEFIEIKVTEDYCWYTEISEVFAQKGGYRHIFKLRGGVLEYVETSYAYISLISSEE